MPLPLVVATAAVAVMVVSSAASLGSWPLLSGKLEESMALMWFCHHLAFRFILGLIISLVLVLCRARLMPKFCRRQMVPTSRLETNHMPRNGWCTNGVANSCC